MPVDFQGGITPEALAENIDRIMDTSNAQVMGIDLWT
jgi:hypothetical protein